MIIDCHNHVLATAEPPGHERFIREMRALGLRGSGQLPSDRPPTEADWAALDVDVAKPVDPGWLVAEHTGAGVDTSVVLAVAPSDYTAYGRRGTVDLAGVTDVDPAIEHGNDAIAALTRIHPELLGMAAVNPRFAGPDAAVEELRRAVEDLGLTGLKLYPMYDQYAIDDLEVSLPVLRAARDLDIGVMIHMGTSSAKDAPLELGRPVAVDAVARALPDLRLLVCHAGWPWVDECLAMAARHDHVYVDVSYTMGRLTDPELAGLFRTADIAGCPTSRICWGTDFPGGGSPSVLLPRAVRLAHPADGADAVLDERELVGLLGGNWARFAGIDHDPDAAADVVRDRTEGWLAAATANGPRLR